MTQSSSSSTQLRWRDAGGLSTEWLVLREAPKENHGFVEKGRYLFPKPGASWSLHVDDERLGDDPNDPSCWQWQPLFFAGEVTAELVSPDGCRVALFLLDVAPNPNKMGRETFGQMIRELLNSAPSLVIGTEPATVAIGDLGTTEDPWLAFARLRRYAPEFFRAIQQVRARPRRTLRVRRDSAALHHVRRVDRRTATALLRSPAVALFLADTGRTTAAFAPDSRLDVPFIEDTLDAAANRAMLALVITLLRRTRVLRDRLQGLVDRKPDSDTRTSLSSRWPARRLFLDDLAAQFKLLVRQSPFADVQRPEMTAAGLTAIATDPTYSRAWGRGWRALRHGIESGESTERLWVSPSWEIYERWCFLRVGQLLDATLPAWNWRRLESPDRWVGSSSGRHAELRLQPTFSARECETETMWSISRERVPDLVLTVQDADAVRFVVLDAKYRTSRSNVLEAMGSAHIYQDSLRIGARRPDASLLLVPAVVDTNWLASPAFQQEHRVGIHKFSPDGDPALPQVALRLWMS